MKKSLIIMMIAIVSMVISWYIGQSVHTNADRNSTSGDLEAVNNSNQNISIEFEGSEQTSDNPYGFTAGMIEFEGENYIFLTPNTACILYNLSKVKNVSLALELHPWVASGSDGAGIDVIAYYEDGSNEQMETIFLENSKGKINKSYNILERKIEKIVLNCQNGTNNNSDADWVMIMCEK